ncbi:MAG TPA: hypothetical protein VES65_05315 [Solirubrobacteraceae bacterium]|nr:hypothetical protein [Solirubrobacteraceae bacterium]
MFTGQYRIPGQKRVENGITGTILDTSQSEDRVTIKTREREPREVDVNTSEFADISLGYAVHVNKGQGLTAETSGVLTGGWQTDREHAYVAVSRAREQTQVYVSREDLGEQGMDVGALERLAERIERSRAQEATIAKEAAERDDHVQPERGSHRLQPRRRPSHTVADEDGIVCDLRDRDAERTENGRPRPVPQATRGTERDSVDIRETNPSEVQITVVDHKDTQLAYSNIYDLKSHTGEPTYALFGGWQTDKTLGYVAAVQHQGHTQTYISTEDRGDRDIETELRDRIGQVIARSQTQHANPANRAHTP